MEVNAAQGEDIAHEVGLDVINFGGFVDMGDDDDIYQGPFHDATIVLFHLSTTDLSRSSEICEISASCNDDGMHKYIIPDKDISHKASLNNKLQIRKIDDKRKMFDDGTEVKSVRPKEGLLKFLKFLKETNGRKVLLAAHQCSFGAQVIIREMQKYDLLDTFQSRVLGFIDTYVVFRSRLPERVDEGRGFDLETLAEDYDLYEESFPEGRHPISNVRILDLLVKKIECTDADMKRHAKELTMFI